MRKRYAERARRDYNRVAGLSASAPDRGRALLPRAAVRVATTSFAAAACAPAISACGPLHGRQAPLPGRQQTPRRQSRSLSGSQRALRTRGVTPGYPRKSAQCHVNAVFSAPLAPRGPPLRRPHGLQSRQPVCSRRVAVPSRLSLPGADHRSRQQRQHAYHRTHDLGHSGPCTVVKRRRLAASGPRGARRPRSGPQRPFRTCGGTLRHPRNRLVPVNAVPSAIPATAGSRAIRHACSRTSNNNPTPALRRRRGTRRRLGLIHISTAPRHPLPAPLPLYRRRFSHPSGWPQGTCPHTPATAIRLDKW